MKEIGTSSIGYAGTEFQTVTQLIPHLGQRLVTGCSRHFHLTGVGTSMPDDPLAITALSNCTSKCHDVKPNSGQPNYI